MICLDTNIVIAVINQRAAVRQQLMKTLHEGTIVGIQRSSCTNYGTASKKAHERRQISMRSIIFWHSMSRRGRLNGKTPKRPVMFVPRWSV